MSVFRIYVDYKPHSDFRNVKTQDKEICISTLILHKSVEFTGPSLNLKTKQKTFRNMASKIEPTERLE